MREHCIGERKLQVLICEPNSGRSVYLPYVWAVLKSWFERNSPQADRVDWLDPIFKRPSLETALDEALQQPLDVLGLSSYAWNFDLQVQIAKKVKQAQPDCLVVMGGPEPDLKDPDFAARHPYIDIVVVQEGEVPFQAILEARLRNSDEGLREIPGLLLRPVGGEEFLPTAPPEKLTTFDHSPYADQFEVLNKLLNNVDFGDLGGILETNRGCPYRCSFCDWGSATNSRVRRFDLQRIETDILHLAKLDVNFIMIADANFGILERDLSIAKLFGKARAAHGAPRSLSYSASKNRSDRNIAIAQILNEGNVLPSHFLSIQHTEESVLAAGERSNISPEKQMLAAKELARSGIALSVQLILGQPGDTPELWRTCLTKLMEWGLHGQVHIYPYILLPNAPAAQADYSEKWELQPLKGLLQTTSSRRPLGTRDGVLHIATLVATKSFSTPDWVELNVLAVLCEALHFCGPTQLVARYLRHSHGVAYHSFYTAILDEFLAVHSVYGALVETVRDHYRRFVTEKGLVHAQARLAEISSYGYYVTQTQWFLFQLVLRRELFYDELGGFLEARFQGIEGLSDVVSYQRQLLITPDYDSSVGKRFSVNYDWPAYFSACNAAFGHESFPMPASVQEMQVEITDTRFGPFGATTLDWSGKMGAARWIAWLDNVSAISCFNWPNLFEQVHLESKVARSEKSARKSGARISQLLHIGPTTEADSLLSSWTAKVSANQTLFEGHFDVPRRGLFKTLQALLGLDAGSQSDRFVSASFFDYEARFLGRDSRPFFELSTEALVQRRIELCMSLRDSFPQSFVLLWLQGHSAALRSLFRWARESGIKSCLAEFLREYRDKLLVLLDFDSIIGIYHRVFGVDRVLVLPQEQLREDPLACFRLLEGRFGTTTSSDTVSTPWAGHFDVKLRRAIQNLAFVPQSLFPVSAPPGLLRLFTRKEGQGTVPQAYLEDFSENAVFVRHSALFRDFLGAYFPTPSALTTSAS